MVPRQVVHVCVCVCARVCVCVCVHVCVYVPAHERERELLPTTAAFHLLGYNTLLRSGHVWNRRAY